MEADLPLLTCDLWIQTVDGFVFSGRENQIVFLRRGEKYRARPAFQVLGPSCGIWLAECNEIDLDHSLRV